MYSIVLPTSVLPDRIELSFCAYEALGLPLTYRSILLRRLSGRQDPVLWVLNVRVGNFEMPTFSIPN